MNARTIDIFDVLLAEVGMKGAPLWPFAVLGLALTLAALRVRGPKA